MGTTEPGSSGSGLWDPESQLLIGTLSGGVAACGLLEFDCNGMFAVAWDRGASASERLQDWLDPDNEGPLTVEGANPNLVPDLPLDIPDNEGAGVSDEQEVEENISITDVDVRVQIDHTRVGDLQIILTSPSGTEVRLLDRPGVPLSDVGCEDDNLDVIFDDGAEIDLEQHCEATTPWYEGTEMPLEPLEALIGETARGTWTLTVVDHAEMETGQLVDWTLNIEGEVSTPNLPLDIPDNDETGVRHTQEVMEDITVADIEVRVQIDHTRVGDIQILLQSPSETEVTLLDRPGVPLTEVGCEDDNLDVTFDDDTKFGLEQICDGMTPWYEGVASPVEALSTFARMPAQGVWTLTVRDRGAMEVGQLINWELNITPPGDAGDP